MLFFVSCHGTIQKAAALVGVHRVETVGLFASFWSQKEGHSGWQPFPRRLPTEKKEGPNGSLPFPPEANSKSTPPPLRGTSPYTGEA